MAVRSLSILATLASLSGLLVAASAQAQSAGTLIGRLGVTHIAPQVTSGDLSAPAFAGTKADVGSNTQPTAGLTWMVTDNIALDLPLGLGFTHEITGAGAIQGVGKIGETKALPISLLFQYRFMEASATLRPYVGLGLTYAKFFKGRSTAALSGLTGGSPSNPTTLAVDSVWGVTGQVGLTYAITPKIGLDVAVLKTKVKTRTTLSTGQTLDSTLDPLSYSAGLSYQF